MSFSHDKWALGVARFSSFSGVDYDDGDKPAAYTEHYKVVMPATDGSAIPASTYNVSGLPSYGDKSSISGFTHLKVTSIQFNPISEESNAWNIDVQYGSRRRSKNSLIDDDAVDASDIRSVTWSVDEITSDFCYDALNNPVTNSAGDPYDTVPQKTEFVPHITVVRRENSLPDLSLNGAINSTEVTILGVTFAKHCARAKISVNLVPDGKPFEVTYEIIGMRNYAPAEGYGTGVFEDWGWDCPMLQCGYQFLDDSGSLRKFTTIDASGAEREVSTPQLLDFEGKDNRGGNPHITRYQLYVEHDLSAFKLPATADNIVITE